MTGYYSVECIYEHDIDSMRIVFLKNAEDTKLINYGNGVTLYVDPNSLELQEIEIKQYAMRIENIL